MATTKHIFTSSIHNNYKIEIKQNETKSFVNYSQEWSLSQSLADIHRKNSLEKIDFSLCQWVSISERWEIIDYWLSPLAACRVYYVP